MVIKKVVTNYNPEEITNLTVSLTKPDGLINLDLIVNPSSDGKNIFVSVFHF